MGEVREGHPGGEVRWGREGPTKATVGFWGGGGDGSAAEHPSACGNEGDRVRQVGRYPDAVNEHKEQSARKGDAPRKKHLSTRGHRCWGGALAKGQRMHKEEAKQKN